MTVRVRFIATNSSISALSWQSELDLLPLIVVFPLYHDRVRFITTNSSISALSWQSELDLLPLTVVFQLYHGSQS